MEWLTSVFISIQAVLTQPHLHVTREEARMREKEEGAGNPGKRGHEMRKGWGEREVEKQPSADSQNILEGKG